MEPLYVKAECKTSKTIYISKFKYLFYEGKKICSTDLDIICISFLLCYIETQSRFLLTK